MLRRRPTSLEEPPSRLAVRCEGELDVFTGWRKMLCYTQRPGVCKRIKRSYRRRVRHMTNVILRRL